MKLIQRIKKKRLNNLQQYNTQDYLLVKKAAGYTRGSSGRYRESYTEPHYCTHTT